jgi:hypothetical protein
MLSVTPVHQTTHRDHAELCRIRDYVREYLERITKEFTPLGEPDPIDTDGKPTDDEPTTTYMGESEECAAYATETSSEEDTTH